MTDFIAYLNHWEPEYLWIIQLLVAYTAVLVMLRLFGKTGLFVYIALTIIMANIQVLKIIQFNFFTHPIALGTVLFTSIYLAVDILTEYYGPKTARKAVMYGLAAMILLMLNMTIAMGFKPLTTTQAIHEHIGQAATIQTHLLAIFSPAPALLFASLLSYLISQYCDIYIFQRIRRKTGKKWLWLRNNVSTILGALLDNIIFNITWITIAGYDISWQAIIESYILGTYFIRVAISVLDTPFIYLAKYLLPKESTKKPQ